MRRAFVISFLINHKSSSATRRCSCNEKSSFHCRLVLNASETHLVCPTKIAQKPRNMRGFCAILCFFTVLCYPLKVTSSTV